MASNRYNVYVDDHGAARRASADEQLTPATMRSSSGRSRGSSGSGRVSWVGVLDRQLRTIASTPGRAGGSRQMSLPIEGKGQVHDHAHDDPAAIEGGADPALSRRSMLKGLGALAAGTALAA